MTNAEAKQKAKKKIVPYHAKFCKCHCCQTFDATWDTAMKESEHDRGLREFTKLFFEHMEKKLGKNWQKRLGLDK